MNIDLSAYRAVLFDVDGTISETEGLGHLPAFNQAFNQYGIDWQWDSNLYQELLKVTGGLERLKTYRSQLENVNQTSTLPSDETLQKIHAAKNEIYAQLMNAGKIIARPGLTYFINQLSSNSKVWGVVTTTSHANWKSLWNGVLNNKLQSRPAITICGEDVTKKKPDPEAYFLASEALGILPKECLAVEDSLNGYLAARDAGMDVMIVRSQFFINESFSGAKFVLNEFTDFQTTY